MQRTVYSNWLKDIKAHEYADSLDIQQGLVKVAPFCVVILYSSIGNVTFEFFLLLYILHFMLCFLWNIENNYKHCELPSLDSRDKTDLILSVFNFVGKLVPCWNINPSLTDSKSSFLICASLKIHCSTCFISMEGKHDKGTCVDSLEGVASMI